MAAHGIGMMFSTVVAAGGKPAVNLAGEVCGNGGGGGGRHGDHRGCFAGRGAVDWKLAGAMGCGYGLVGQQHYGHVLLRPAERWRSPAVALGLQQQPSTSPSFEAAKELDDQLSRRALDLDPRGYFVIRVDRKGGEIVAEFFRNVINSAGLACDPDTGKVIPCDGSYRPRPYSIFRMGPLPGIEESASQKPGKPASWLTVLMQGQPNRANPEDMQRHFWGGGGAGLNPWTALRQDSVTWKKLQISEARISRGSRSSPVLGQEDSEKMKATWT